MVTDLSFFCRFSSILTRINMIRAKAKKVKPIIYNHIAYPSGGWIKNAATNKITVIPEAKATLIQTGSLENTWLSAPIPAKSLPKSATKVDKNLRRCGVNIT